MFLVFHIILAILSVIIATVGIFFPSKRILRAVYILSAGTLLSGVGLGIANHALLLQVCTSGSVFLVFVIITSLITHHRLISAIE